MGNVLIKAAAFVVVIVLGYLLKRRGFFRKEDFGILSRIVINITLPCAIIMNFSRISLQSSLLVAVGLGLGCNLVTVGFGYLYALRKSGTEKAFYMLNLSGYNIGCFTMPFVQSFLGPTGMVVTSLFDAGNSLMCTGASYSLASLAAGKREGSAVSSFLKKMFRSVPLDTYLVMLILGLFQLPLPAFVGTFADIVGSANGFMAMLMLGVGFELKLEKAQLARIFRHLALRFGMSAVFALLFYFCLPLPLEVRQVLAIVVFAPVSAVATAFTQRCDGDVALSSAINSLSIVVSVIIITGLLLTMGLG